MTMLAIEAVENAPLNSSDTLVRNVRTLKRLKEGRYSSKAESPTVSEASAWSLVGFAVSQGLRLGNNMVLSYLLLPEAFGVMAIVSLVIAGLGMFSEVGAGPCIVQSPNGTDSRFINTAWLIAMMRGVCTTLFASLLAYPIASFYSTPLLAWIIPCASLTGIIDGFCSPTIFLAQRRLDLRAIAWLDIRSQFAGAIVMCVAAWISPTVWSLVLGAIATSLTRSTLSFGLASGHTHQFLWDQASARELLRFGKWILVSTILAFGATQVDRMIMGRIFDLSVLGMYGFSLAIAMMPRVLIEKLSMSVLYPIIARAKQVSIDSIRSELFRARNVILAVGVAMTVSVYAWSPAFFDYLYHERFQSCGPICQWLCPSVWIGMLSLTLSRAVVALGDSRSLAIFNSVKLVSTIFGSLVGCRLGGLDGFIVGATLGVLVGHFLITWRLYQHEIQLIRQDVLYSLSLFAACSTCYASSQLDGQFFFTDEITNAVTCVVVWLWAGLQVKAYRDQENSSTNKGYSH
jgi:O-antigen/teichoic acid export membrane protein